LEVETALPSRRDFTFRLDSVPCKGAERTSNSVSRVEDLERLYRERGNRLWWALLAFTGDREVTNDAMAEHSLRPSNIETGSEFRRAG
jgi:hypothetical protein